MNLESEILNRSEILSATEEGFRGWIELERERLWEEYLECLELADRAMREKFRSVNQ